jgi:hypothetical protein
MLPTTCPASSTSHCQPCLQVCSIWPHPPVVMPLPHHPPPFQLLPPNFLCNRPPLHATTQPPKPTAGDTVVSSLDCPHPPPRAALSGYHVPSNKNECAETRTLCFNRKLKIFQEKGKTIHSSLEYLLELNVAASKIQGKGYSNLKIRKKEP